MLYHLQMKWGLQQDRAWVRTNQHHSETTKTNHSSSSYHSNGVIKVHKSGSAGYQMLPNGHPVHDFPKFRKSRRGLVLKNKQKAATVQVRCSYRSFSDCTQTKPQMFRSAWRCFGQRHHDNLRAARCETLRWLLTCKITTSAI